MGHTKIVVDHARIDYKGPVQLNNFFRLIENHLWERGYDKRQDKDFEMNTSNGKYIEWQYTPYRKITDYVRYFIKVRVIGHDFVKTDVTVEKKKTKVDSRRLVISIDAFIEYVYDNYWDSRPFLLFWRVIYDYFVFKSYTEKFESTLKHDAHILIESVEKFLNMHRHYEVISQ